MAHQNENENECRCKKTGVSDLGATPDAKLAGANAEAREDTVVVSWATPLGLFHAALGEHHTTIVREIQDDLNTRVDGRLDAQGRSAGSAGSGHDGTERCPKLGENDGDDQNDCGCGCGGCGCGGCGYGGCGCGCDGCGCDGCGCDNPHLGSCGCDDPHLDSCGCGPGDCGCGCGEDDEDDAGDAGEDDTLRGGAADDIATAVARVLTRTRGVPVPAAGRIEMELSFTGVEKISLSGEYDLAGRRIDEDLTLVQVDDEIARATAELVREHRLAEVDKTGVLSFTGSLGGWPGGPFGGQGSYRLR